MRSQVRLALRYGSCGDAPLLQCGPADELRMKILPDPRVYPPFSANSLVRLAAEAARGGSAVQHRNVPAPLTAAMRQALQAQDNALIERAFAEAGSPEQVRMLTEALESALSGSGDNAAAHLRLFAVPIVIVTGGRAPLRVPGVLTDAARIEALLRIHGALGQLENFALNRVLTSAAGLARLEPATLYRLARQVDTGQSPSLDVAPETLDIVSTEEQAHLRFLTGVAVAPAGAPGFAETAGNIVRWGLPLTRELAAQLAQPGLSLLTIPRPPMSLRRALEAGVFAQREIGLQLFLSAALRSLRARSGEPRALVGAHADGSVRVRLRSPFDTQEREYAWLLQRGDELDAVSRAIFTLLEACRVMDVQSLDAIEPV